MKGDQHPSLPVQRHCPRPPRNVEEACQSRQPNNIQRLEVLRADVIHPRSPATAELFNHLGDLSLGDERVQPRVPSLCFHQGMRDGRIEEILEVLLPPPDNVLSRGQQPPTPTVNSVGEALLPPPEVPDGLPESLLGQPVVLLHGLTKLLAGLGFCLCHSPGRGTLGPTVPVSRLRSPTSQSHSFFSLTASLTAHVHHRVLGLPPRQAPQTLRLQLRAAASTIDAENMVHSDSLCLQHPPGSGQSSPRGGS
ncbi:hypothetical protein CHARACLAT_019384 [Characodon lateralis]|uniref:Uncharacterized protein n=1 Tax=Characodon lateralis TaxID=208331 RepID=A0ABU7DK40_9TELE|nr:hypothetical protein [Characodon lateralis]